VIPNGCLYSPAAILAADPSKMRPSLPVLCSVSALCFLSQARGQTPSSQQAVRAIAIEDGTESPATWNLDIADRRTTRLTSGVQGATGLLHTSSADLGRAGILRFSGVGEYVHATNFPVPTAVETRSAGTFAASFVPFSFFELYAAYSASSNINSNSIPVRIQSIGDGAAGLKFSAHLARGLYSGVEGRAMLFSRSGGEAARTSGWGASPRFLLTYDAREQAPQVPLRFHLNAGFLWDTTRSLQPTRAFGAAEQFAYNANNFNRVFGSAGMEIPLPILTPFGEYSITYPLGVPGNRLVDPSGNSIPLTAALPQIVTMGLKVTAIQDLTLIAAIDLRVHSSVAIGIPTPAPFDVFFGASLNVDPWRARTQIVPIVKEVPAAQAMGRIAGTVSDAATHAPIAGALILFGPTDLPPVASNAGSGKFLSYELPRGAIKLKVVKTGYEDLEQQVQIESGRTLVLPLEMKLAVRRTHLWVSVASDNRGVAARVSIRGPAIREVATVEGASEALDVEVKPGAYALAVSAPGYLGQTRSIEIGEGAELAVKFDLVPEPKEKLVTIVNKKIETVRRIHFITAKATLLPDSYALLQQVADLILKSDIKRIRIVGHTDNSGTKKRNLKLSVARAASVAEFLEKAGIDKKRIETTGYGDARPVVPNLTARGREINRRVEILILD